jgi:hypothetical protein
LFGVLERAIVCFTTSIPSIVLLAVSWIDSSFLTARDAVGCLHCGGATVGKASETSFALSLRLPLVAEITRFVEQALAALTTTWSIVSITAVQPFSGRALA